MGWKEEGPAVSPPSRSERRFSFFSSSLFLFWVRRFCISWVRPWEVVYMVVL